MDFLNLHTLHTITGIAILALLAGKIILHLWLDYRLGQRIGIAMLLLFFMRFFQSYKNEVPQALKPWKRICNIFLPLALIMLLLNFIIGIAML